MPLAAVMDSLDGLSEDLAALYTEKNGKFELTGITGVKTQADIERVTAALNHEKTNHAATKERFSVWADMDHEDVVAKLDKFPELEAAAAGKLDENEIEGIVARRVEGTVKSQIAPLERQIAALTKERDDARAQATEFGGIITRGKINDSVRSALTEAKVIEHARDDALLLAERLFEVREDDGAIVTRDGVGVTPGITAKDWISEIQTANTRPHWWGPTSGGGANPGGGRSGMGGDNPWSKDHWNMTKQSAIIREKGQEVANRMAKAAGHKSALGAIRSRAS